MIIEGDLFIGEATPWAGRAMRRFSHGVSFSLAIALMSVLGLMGVAVFLYFLMEIFLDASPVMLPIMVVCAGGIGGAISNRLCRAAALNRFRRALLSRGVQNPLPSRLEMRDDLLITTCGDVVQTAPWRAVSEVLDVGPYWVVVVQAAPVFIPKRHLAGETEREFLSEISSRMSPESVERSSPRLRLRQT